jgi:hypothetical protein
MREFRWRDSPGLRAGSKRRNGANPSIEDYAKGSRADCQVRARADRARGGHGEDPRTRNGRSFRLPCALNGGLVVRALMQTTRMRPKPDR